MDLFSVKVLLQIIITPQQNIKDTRNNVSVILCAISIAKYKVEKACFNKEEIISQYFIPSPNISEDVTKVGLCVSWKKLNLIKLTG